ncbi:MAG: ABC-type phosphate/phosphonate transport system substrate-binding protein [Candidatus Poriferisodalaceae bacterium]|jgi:ABC-type phosphate/phosphonate transport system substrate-binding protein
MYHWHEVNWAVEVLWCDVSDRLRAQDVGTPEGLTRIPDIRAQWVDPDLFIGQTCGLSYAERIRPFAAVIGALTYGISGAGPGEYCSHVVTRSDSGIDTLEDMRGRVVAFNDQDSESGKGSTEQLVAPLASNGRFFAGAVETGGHRTSIVAVANGQADVSAIDAVSFEPKALASLQIIHTTSSSPGTPMITARKHESLVPGMRRAFADAVATLDPGAASALRIIGFHSREDEDEDCDVIANPPPSIWATSTCSDE